MYRCFQHWHLVVKSWDDKPPRGTRSLGHFRRLELVLLRKSWSKSETNHDRNLLTLAWGIFHERVQAWVHGSQCVQASSQINYADKPLYFDWVLHWI